MLCHNSTQARAQIYSTWDYIHVVEFLQHRLLYRYLLLLGTRKYGLFTMKNKRSISKENHTFWIGITITNINWKISSLIIGLETYLTRAFKKRRLLQKDDTKCYHNSKHDSFTDKERLSPSIWIAHSYRYTRIRAHTNTTKKKKRRSDPVMEQRFQTVGENPAWIIEVQQ